MPAVRAMPKSHEQVILLIDDAEALAHPCEQILLEEGYMVVEHQPEPAMECLDYFMPSAMVINLLNSSEPNKKVLRHAQRLYPNLPVVIIAPAKDQAVATEALQLGAFDFITAPFAPERLKTTIRIALERKALKEEVTEWRQTLGQSQFHDFVGHCSAMQAVYLIIDSVAASKASVFIRGEPGSGKELAARALHKASIRRSRPFAMLDCASIPPEAMEGHLFGFARAISGNANHTGVARSAHGGTLYIDEICEMPMGLQGKLLKFLQTGEAMPAGGTKAIPIDVRVVASTSRDPLAEVRGGRLREDLYYRLHVIPLDMPPLRERDEDVIQLAHHFLAQYNIEETKNFTGFDTDVIALLRRYDWPGNVRQLENVIRNIVVLNTGTLVTQAMMPSDLRRFMGETILPAANQNGLHLISVESAPPSDPIKPLWLTEKEAIMVALDFTRYDITRAAMLLEVSPSTLYRKLQLWKSAQRVA